MIFFKSPGLHKVNTPSIHTLKLKNILTVFIFYFLSQFFYCSLDGLVLRGCQNLTSTAEVLPPEASKFYRHLVNVTVIDAPSLSTVNLTRFSSLQHISLRGNRVTHLESETLMDELQVFELESAHSLKQIEARFFSSFTPNLKTLSVTLPLNPQR